MRLVKLGLKNWKNFAKVEVELAPRVFIIGNNGAGKSNLLDALRFLRDIANPKSGGMQQAIETRGGMKKIRNFGNRRDPSIGIWAETKSDDGKDKWGYEIFLKQENGGQRRVLVKSEIVKHNDKVIFSRPNIEDKKDPGRLTQTALEQTSVNMKFRALAKFFQDIKYIHIVPQLIRYGSEIQGKVMPGDPFGQDIMNAIAAVSPRLQKSRLGRIGRAIKTIKPAFAGGGDLNFEFIRDKNNGKPHIKFKYPGWRQHDMVQTEEILSDGELRLVGLLWTLMESHPVVLLEEPEISFNEKIVSALPNIFADAVESKKKGQRQQIIMSTHNYELLDDPDITDEELLLLHEKQEKTDVVRGCDHPRIKVDMKHGLSAAKAALRYAQTKDAGRLFQ